MAPKTFSLKLLLIYLWLSVVSKPKAVPPTRYSVTILNFIRKSHAGNPVYTRDMARSAGHLLINK